MNASITFSTSPWLLFIMLPVFAAILALVFARKKRGKISSNLIFSALFQCLVASLFVFAISGIRVEYDEQNFPKEVAVLVDTSYTAKTQRENMDEFVHDILKQSVGQCRVGVVLFGQGQEVALEMSDLKTFEDAEKAYQKYKTSFAVAKDNATDIASALKFVWTPQVDAHNFISDPAHSRIVVLSDGLETDGDAISAMKELTRSGVQLETSFYADSYQSDASILEVKYPDSTIYAGNKINITVVVKSSYKASATLEFSDKNDDGEVKESKMSIELQAGTQQIALPHSFDKEGFHELTFHLNVSDDEKQENNVFCSYFEVKEKTQILILETYQGESNQLKSALDEIGQKNNIEIVIRDIKTATNEMTADTLSEYSEVILYNFAVEDLSENFQSELKTYVNEKGGGLFTVGGFEKDEQGNIKTTPRDSNPEEEVPVLHSYRESDLQESILADMLPVNIQAYKPAVAVVFIFDVSTSMTGSSASSIVTAAEDARYILDNVLEPKDYVSVVTLQSSYAETTPLSSVTKKEEIKQSITQLESFWDWDASTEYAPALGQAARILSNAPAEVAKKHIILFSDGGPKDKLPVYGQVMQEAHDTQGINITVVTYYHIKKIIDGVPYYFNHSYDVKGWEINVDNMETLAGIGGGHNLLLPHTKDDITNHSVAPVFRKDLKLDQLEDICYESFTPKKGEESPILENVTGLALQNLKLDGYFISRAKIDRNVSVPLLANGAPLYAEWKYGSGKVGSILIDLEGKWSNDLISTDTGKTILGNIMFSLLMNVEPPKEETMEGMVIEDNFRTQVNIFNLQQEEQPQTKLVAMVQSPDMSQPPTKYDLGPISSGCRFVFENLQVGTYKIYVMKVKSNYDFMEDEVLSPEDIPSDMLVETMELRRSFSYSKEFDSTIDPYTTGQDLLASLSSRQPSDGTIYSKFIYDAEKIFQPNGNIHRVKDLRQMLLIAALVLYFLGIIFRLFKLKKSKYKTK